MKKQILQLTTVILSLVVFAVFFAPGLLSAQTATNEALPKNLSGYAWSSTVGWISLSCENRGTCSTSNYWTGVKPDGEIAGFAWSPNIGWISFNKEHTISCPYGACGARLDQATGKVSGWAKALAGNMTYNGGWDGWIRLGQDSRVDVSASGCSWSGHAWGGGDSIKSSVVGWLSFAGPGYGVTGSGDACQSTGAVSASLTASPTTVRSGENSTLTWSSSNAEQCVGTNFTTNGATSGSTTVTPEQTTTYTLTCTGPGGSAQDQKSVTISVADPDLTAGNVSVSAQNNGRASRFVVPITNEGNGNISQGIDIYFQIDIGSNGSDFDLNLTANDAVVNLNAGQTKNGAYTWNNPPSGTHEVRACADLPNNEIAESNENNNCGAITTFTVNNPDDAVVASCSANKGNAQVGETVTWTASVSGANGPVQYSWSGSENLSGSSSSVQKAYSSPGTKTARVEVSDNLSSTTVDCTTPTTGGGGGGGVVVTPNPTASLEADPNRIVVGESATLTWQSVGAGSCSGTGFSTGGATSGSVQVTPTRTSTYQVRCDSANDFETVTVLQPEISITADGEEDLVRVPRNKVVTIAWNAEDIDSCDVEGPGILINNATEDPFTGDADVTISARSTYTISCEAAGQTFTDSVIVNIPPDFEEF